MPDTATTPLPRVRITRGCALINQNSHAMAFMISLHLDRDARERAEAELRRAGTVVVNGYRATALAGEK